jgi:hypothetical protein
VTSHGCDLILQIRTKLNMISSTLAPENEREETREMAEADTLTSLVLGCVKDSLKRVLGKCCVDCRY